MTQMYSIIGLNTKQTYAEGSKADCFRELDKKYKYGTLYVPGSAKRKRNIYPEPLKVVRT